MSIEDHTPVIKQFLNIKKTHPNDMVFFRMGDFYELFYEDAIEAAQILGITLTQRGKSASKPVVMAGVPISAHQNYLKKLIEAGKSVAICEQITDSGNSKGLVQRKVVRIITAGTLCDEGLVSEKNQTWLLSFNAPQSISLLDVSTGELFWFMPSIKMDEKQSSISQIITTLSKFEIGEVLFPESKDNSSSNNKEILFQLSQMVSGEKMVFLPAWEFNARNGLKILQKRLQISSVDALELTDVDTVLGSISALINYAEKNIGQPLNHLRFPKKIRKSQILTIDSVAQRSLEIKRPLYENTNKKITLISCIDRCQTSGGSRLLKNWVLSPLQTNKLPLKRQRSISWISKKQRIHSSLRGVIDVSRVVGRISLSNTTPRELFALSKNLLKLVEVNQLIQNSSDENIEKIYQVFSDPRMKLVINKITACLREDCTNKIKNGGFIRNGFDSELEKFRLIQESGDEFITKLEIKEKEKTGISNLKIGYSPIQGFFFEVTESQKNKVPTNYTRKQTLKNSERFTTSELTDLGETILVAREKSIEREKIIFSNLLCELQTNTDYLFNVSESLSLLDVFATLALKIQENNWTMPQLSNEAEIRITKGSHPVLSTLGNCSNFEFNYYPNNTELDKDKRMMLLTGPNMSGKSTYMKQVALITILARIGSPVPAEEAKIGTVDRIFTRIGAADDLAGGRSTFMVEMTEAAKILHESTNKSLVLLDEIGRGTSTSDGLALAIAIATELSQCKKALCLFATHYFEITELEKTLDGIDNFHISTEENEEKIIFLYELKKGPASKSFGLKVAKLAGIPLSVLKRANTISITSHPNQDSLKPEILVKEDLTLTDLNEKIINEIKDLEPNDCTPNKALNLLFKWKKSLDPDNH